MLRRLGMENFGEKIADIFNAKIPDHLISGEFVAPIKPGKKYLHLTVPYQHLSKMHPADIADMISDLNAQERSSIIEFLDDETAADVVPELSPEMQVELLKSLDEEKAADILEEMDPDEAVDVLQDMPEQQTERLLSLMPEEDAEDLRELMTFDEDEAGGLMNTDFISFSLDLTAEKVINWMRDNEPDADMIYYIYVIDEKERLIGILSLRGLIIAKPEMKLKELMNTDVVSINLDTKQKELNTKFPEWKDEPIILADNKKIVKTKDQKAFIDKF